MDLLIRPIVPEEWAPLCRVIGSAFAEFPTDEEIERWRRVADYDRTFAALDGRTIVGGASAIAMSVSVPGGEVAMAGITGLGVAPSHRRRGIGTELIRRTLDDAREARGEPIAGLWASESRIYRRYGFGVATASCRFEIERVHSDLAVPPVPHGRVRLLDKDEALRAFPPVHDSLRPLIPGMPTRSDGSWDNLFEHEHVGEPPPFYVLHEGPDGPDAYAFYRVKPEWGTGVPAHVVEVGELLATGPLASAAMWRYLLDLDLVATIRGWGRPIDDPLWYLLADPRRLRLTLGDGQWIRLIEVPRALEARRYAVEGALVFEVRDAFCPWNEGGYRLEGGPDGSTCVPTDADADLVVHAEHLGAAYLGGFAFTPMLRAGGIAEGRPGSAALADRMFLHQPAPWCPGEY